MIEAALIARLLETPAVAALIGGDSIPAARIYPIVLPQKPTFPAITYQDISTVRDRTAQGPSGLAFARIQFDCWAAAAPGAPGYASAKALLAAVRAALDGFTGNRAGVEIQDASMEGDRSSFNAGLHAYLSSADVEVWFEE